MTTNTVVEALEFYAGMESSSYDKARDALPIAKAQQAFIEAYGKCVKLSVPVEITFEQYEAVKGLYSAYAELQQLQEGLCLPQK